MYKSNIWAAGTYLRGDVIAYPGVAPPRADRDRSLCLLATLDELETLTSTIT